MTKRQLTEPEVAALRRKNLKTAGWLLVAAGVAFNSLAAVVTAASPNPAKVSENYDRALAECPFHLRSPQGAELDPVIAITGCLAARGLYFGVKIGSLAPASAKP